MKSEHEPRARVAPQGGFVPLSAAIPSLDSGHPPCANASKAVKAETTVKARAKAELNLLHNNEERVLEKNGKAGKPGAESEAWPQVRERLRERIGEDKFVSWFGEASFVGVANQLVTLSVSTKFLRSWIKSNYSDLLVELFRAAGVDARRVDVLERGSVVATIPTTEAPAAAEPVQRAESGAVALRVSDSGKSEPVGSLPDKRMTFESFMVSPSNLVAHAAASRIASAFDQVQFNPLYIHGSVGLGKTHLLHALSHAAREKGKRVLYLTADSFRFGFLKALTNRQAAASFKETIRGFDLLLIDDLQFLQGKYTEAEFGHTLNALLDGSRQVVVSCDRRPADLETFDERLRSRLGGGLTVQIMAPEEELRRQILHAKADSERQRFADLVIPESVIAFIARSVDSNGRDLEGALNRLVHYHQLRRNPITIEMAEESLRGFVKARDPKRVKIDDIIRIAAKYYNISRNDLLSSRRTRNVVMPRQIAMFLAKSMTPRSLPEIGSRFGNRDHTTVLHAVRKIEGLVQKDQQLANDIDVLRQMVLEA